MLKISSRDRLSSRQEVNIGETTQYSSFVLSVSVWCCSSGAQNAALQLLRVYSAKVAFYTS